MGKEASISFSISFFIPPHLRRTRTPFTLGLLQKKSHFSGQETIFPRILFRGSMAQLIILRDGISRTPEPLQILLYYYFYLILLTAMPLKSLQENKDVSYSTFFGQVPEIFFILFPIGHAAWLSVLQKPLEGCDARNHFPGSFDHPTTKDP